MGAVLGYVNHADTATLSTTTSGSMLRPLTELQVKWARGLCRGPANGDDMAPATLVIRADLGSSKVIHAIACIGLNGVISCGMTVALSTSSFGATDAGSVGASWGFNHIDEDFGQGLFVVPQSGHWQARYIEITINVVGRPSGQRYVDVRRLLIMAGGYLSDGVDFDWSMKPIDLSESSVTPRGGVFAIEAGKFRELSFSVSGMTLDEAQNNNITDDNADSLTRALARGTAREMLVILRYTDVDQEMANGAIYGRLVDWSPIVHTGGDTYACNSITVHETPHPAL